jgi:hypothetical protein
MVASRPDAVVFRYSQLPTPNLSIATDRLKSPSNIGSQKMLARKLPVIPDVNPLLLVPLNVSVSLCERRLYWVITSRRTVA